MGYNRKIRKVMQSNYTVCSKGAGIGIPHINYTVDLERLSPNRDEFDIRDHSDTMLPEGIETIHPRFTISWRNKWMMKHSDHVATYITHSWDGAAQFAEIAKRQKKTVTNLI